MLFNEMKIVVLIAGGRTGSDFFQSLLDGHPEISQLPGIFDFDSFWSKLKSKKENNLETICKTFTEDYVRFFDSRVNKKERHHMLGRQKNGFFTVDKNFFCKSFISLMNDKDINKKNLIYCLNLAYSQASGEDLKKKKIIFLHLHLIKTLETVSNLDFEIVYMTRHPLGNYSAVMNEWLNYKEGKHMNPWTYYFHMDRIFNGLKSLMRFNKHIHVVQLEKLHTENIKVMKDFCNSFKIEYNQTMTKSTYHGKSWWGDELSEKFLDGINPNFKNNINFELFFNKDIQCLETYLKNFFKKYNYSFTSTGLKYSFLKYLPLKIELIIFKRAILSFNIKQVFLIIIYWIKRINLMNKKNFDNVIFPNSIGSKL